MATASGRRQHDDQGRNRAPSQVAFVLTHIGRFAEAREILQDGLRAAGARDEFLAARLYNRLARVEFDGIHDYDAALRAFEAASSGSVHTPKTWSQGSSTFGSIPGWAW